MDRDRAEQASSEKRLKNTELDDRPDCDADKIIEPNSDKNYAFANEENGISFTLYSHLKMSHGIFLLILYLSSFSFQSVKGGNRLNPFVNAVLI